MYSDISLEEKKSETVGLFSKLLAQEISWEK